MLLNCHTYYSFCYGLFSIERLFYEIEKKGYDAFVLTDINNTSACLETIRRCKMKGYTARVGIDFRNNYQQVYVGIARNNEGFMELNQHLSMHLHQNMDFNPIAPKFNQVYIIYPLTVYKGWKLEDNEFVGVSPKQLSHLSFLQSKIPTHKLVVLQTATFTKGILQLNSHKLLRAIDTNSLLSKLPQDQLASADDILPEKAELEKCFSSYPHILKNTKFILDDCAIDFEFGKLSNKNLKHYTGSASEDSELLRSECMKNLHYRYTKPGPIVMQRIEKELEVITQLNFSSYYLINWDIVRYAQHKDYYYVGRGSGANSIVAYLLRITDVDPVELDLYFERFINIYRNNAPDFDMDFSWTDRDDITRYIFERHGKERTALLGAYNTFQDNAIIRELGKVFGLPPAEIERLQHANRYRDIDEIGKRILKYGTLLKGFPNHLSIHSSGIIISEAPITAYSATNMPPKGYPTTQFSMMEAEDIGLYKFDILSQRGLGKIKDTLGIVKENKNVDIDIHNISAFKHDEKIKEMLRIGNTIGCFYVESPAMRMLLAKLRADDYLRLVAASSIIRPGVSKSGMMREYIIRFRNEDLRKKAREEIPELYSLLEETYGVMVYQEDVIKIAHYFAGLTLAEADYLRRGMSWKFKQRNEFSQVREKFFSNCLEKGYSIKLITDIWNQIESFANFAFSKGHSASYAVESYQALFLKAWFPLEYMVATLNNGGGFYRKELYIHEARMQGAIIKHPCINNSNAMSNIKGNIIYLGLAMIGELEQQMIQRIIAERNQNGLFKSLSDFVNRIPVSIEQMRILIRAGAFAFTERNKKELLWDIHAILRPAKVKTPEKELFEKEIKQWKLPALMQSQTDDAFEEIEMLGFSLISPFQLLKNEIPSKMKASDLVNFKNQKITIVGYFVHAKRTSTSKGEKMYFGTFIDTDGHWIDTVHFPESADHSPFTGPGCYTITGKVKEEYDFISVEVEQMKHLPVMDRDEL
ncbi:MAG: DNA polymerase III subunit alpha [Bacteroidetes bacterium]|nr:DNA polymerase III subunit alpha [Bacteroidota bacterium]